MYLRVLGTAGGGGYPQWNCSCRLCSLARQGDPRVRARTHACLAVSGTGKKWYLVNATPDVRLQIESFPSLHPGPGVRETPLAGVLLTDAELDHTIGLLILREGSPLDVYGSQEVLATLTDFFPVRRILQSYTPLSWHPVTPGEPFFLDGDRLRVQSFRVGCKKPRYAAHAGGEGTWVTGYRFEDMETKGVAVYAPSVESWDESLVRQMAGADCVLLDGTFWTEDEMIQAGAGSLTAREMGHLPISGPEGTASHLSLLEAKRRIYIHINNTNPVLDEESPESRFLAEEGIEVGWDGMEVEV